MIQRRRPLYDRYNDWAWELDPNAQLWKDSIAVFFGKGGGTEAIDSSPYRGNGVLSDTTQSIVIPELRCKGWSFDSTQFIVASSHDAMNFGNGTSDEPFTISFWINKANWAANSGVVGRYAVPRNYTVQVVSSRIYCFVYDNSASGYRGRYASIAGHLANNEWGHVRWEYDGGGLTSSTKIFINGVQQDDGDFSGGSYTAMDGGASDLYLGWDGAASTKLTGSLANVRISRGIARNESPSLPDYGGAIRSTVPLYIPTTLATQSSYTTYLNYYRTLLAG